MEKHSINLLIKKREESPIVSKLKVYLPIAAAVSLIVFIAISAATYFYLSSNLSDYQKLTAEAEQLKHSVEKQKNKEGLFTLTNRKLSVLKQVSGLRKDYSKILTEVRNLPVAGVSIGEVSINHKGEMSFSIQSKSVSSLDKFIDRLLKEEKENLFSDITARGIVRDKEESYTLTISFKVNQKLFL